MPQERLLAIRQAQQIAPTTSCCCGRWRLMFSLIEQVTDAVNQADWSDTKYLCADTCYLMKRIILPRDGIYCAIPLTWLSEYDLHFTRVDELRFD